MNKTGICLGESIRPLVGKSTEHVRRLHSRSIIDENIQRATNLLCDIRSSKLKVQLSSANQWLIVNTAYFQCLMIDDIRLQDMYIASI